MLSVASRRHLDEIFISADKGGQGGGVEAESSGIIGNQIRHLRGMGGDRGALDRRHLRHIHAVSAWRRCADFLLSGSRCQPHTG